MAEKRKTKKEIDWEKHHADKDHKTMVIKICVISISVIIVLLWGFSLRNRFVFADWNSTPELGIVKSAQEQWQSLNEEKNNNQKIHDNAYATVKEQMAKIMAEANKTITSSETGKSSSTTEPTESSDDDENNISTSSTINEY